MTKNRIILEIKTRIFNYKLDELDLGKKMKYAETLQLQAKREALENLLLSIGD